jgi:hypothetical protein
MARHYYACAIFAAMTFSDLDWFSLCCKKGLVGSRFLEIGSAQLQPGVKNLCTAAKEHGIKNVVGVDLQQTLGVDHIVDFSVPADAFKSAWNLGEFDTVAGFNILEHTFDPIRILDNALSCVGSNATMLAVTPTIWPIHNCPGDFVRLLPDWYRTYAKERGLTIIEECFCWLSDFGIEPIGADPEFPTYLSRKPQAKPSRYWVSRISHKFLNTYGRSHWATYCAIGAAMKRN